MFGSLWWFVALLVGLLVGLGVALLLGTEGKSTVVSVPVGVVSAEDVRREVDVTCSAFGIDPKKIRVRQPGASGGEHRIVVDEQFRPLEFHYALSKRLAKKGVNIVGEERPREKKVALRLLIEGKPVWSVQLVIQKSSGKEDHHRP